MKCLLGIAALATACSGGMLQVAPDQRTLTTSEGKPFLWIGDTAWELFHRLNREEAVFYLDRRAGQGFNVIQAVVLAESDGLRSPNAYGAVPFHDLDPNRPNEAFFEHVDFVIREGNRRGLQMVVLPTWGDKVPNSRPGGGPVIFNSDNARSYGRFLGARYRDASVVWMLGGDRSVETDEAHGIWRSMAEGLREGDGGVHLMTYHPAGEETSAFWFHNEPWLDFNVFQSGHAMRFHPVFNYTAELTLLQPRKPFIDVEPPYEDIPLRFWDYMDWSSAQRVPTGVVDHRGLLVRPEHFPLGLFDDHDVRVHAYWNLLAGAAGFTYGNNAVWQMHREGQDYAIPSLHDWRTALDRPGARQMKHVRTLFERRSFTLLRPDQSIVYGPNPFGPHHVRAALSDKRDFLIVYLAVGRPVTLVLGKVQGAKAQVRWFNPRTGAVSCAGSVANQGRHVFTPPTQGAKEDWVLVIEAQDATLSALGNEQGI